MDSRVGQLGIGFIRPTIRGVDGLQADGESEEIRDSAYVFHVLSFSLGISPMAEVSFVPVAMVLAVTTIEALELETDEVTIESVCADAVDGERAIEAFMAILDGIVVTVSSGAISV